MPPKGHAVLSASSSDRWLHCPPSARLCESYTDKGSDYAAEGTDAHALCEYKLRKALGLTAVDPTENLAWFNEEMDDCATGYAAYVLEQVEAAKQVCADPVVLIEQRVDFSRWVEDGFGTADALIIADGTLKICDYKHGLGVLVRAEENPQLMCYALGALELFDKIYDIDTVSMTIYQPRRNNVSTFEMSKDDLYQWADEVLKPTAELAFAGDGNFLCGEWCGFCKAKTDCRARAEAAEKRGGQLLHHRRHGRGQDNPEGGNARGLEAAREPGQPAGQDFHPGQGLWGGNRDAGHGRAVLHSGAGRSIGHQLLPLGRHRGNPGNDLRRRQVGGAIRHAL